MTTRPVIGIDLGGTNMQIGVVSPALEMLASAKRKTKAEESLDDIVERIISGVEEACQNAGISISGFAGIGLGAPGVVDPIKGVVIEAVNLRWDQVPLARILTRKLGRPAFIDNDVNAAVLGENLLGAGKNSTDLLGVWVGTGIGGGLILNGTLYYGHFRSAGEIGHTILFPHHAKGQRSLEHNCSRTAIVDRLVRLLRSNQKSKITAEVGGDFTRIRSRTLAKYYHGGPKEDRLVIEVVDHAAQELGTAIASAVTLLSLPRVVLGGGLPEALGKPYVQRVEAATRDLAFPRQLKEVKVVGSELGDNAGVFGAAMIALERLRRHWPVRSVEV
jgi:glucokinase